MPETEGVFGKVMLCLKPTKLPKVHVRTPLPLDSSAHVTEPKLTELKVGDPKLDVFKQGLQRHRDFTQVWALGGDNALCLACVYCVGIIT